MNRLANSNRASALLIGAALFVLNVASSGCSDADALNAANDSAEASQAESSEAANSSPESATSKLNAEPSADDTRIAKSPKEILSDPNSTAFCYGGFRGPTRDQVPTVDQIKNDMRILAALGVKIVRTYNTQQFDHAARLLAAIQSLRDEDPGFEMYVMLGAWIDCEQAWTDTPNHEGENEDGNRAEIEAAIELANRYPDIVRVIAVGNEAMVHWAANYFVRPGVILKWVEHLQALKSDGKLPSSVWITSSDNFAAWGGGTKEYHTDDLKALIKAVDYISLHTYPFHHTHYDPEIWGVPESEASLSESEQIEAAVERAMQMAKTQYADTAAYVASLGVERPIHIGETGWASRDHALYGPDGSRAADELKAALFYKAMRDWTTENSIACFYFEAFDEQWKDPSDAAGSENHFGLLTLQGQAKYALWDQVDAGVFDGLNRDGVAVSKTFQGDRAMLMKEVVPVPRLSELDRKRIDTTNEQRTLGDSVTESTLVVLNEELDPSADSDATFPSAPVKLNVWEGTCAMVLDRDNVIQVTSGTGDWWGCGLEVDGGGEELSKFQAGQLHFEIRGKVSTAFEIGIQSGNFGAGTQVNGFQAFNVPDAKVVTDQWQSCSLSIDQLMKTTDSDSKVDLSNVTTLLFVRGIDAPSNEQIELRNIYWTQD